MWKTLRAFDDFTGTTEQLRDASTSLVAFYGDHAPLRFRVGTLTPDGPLTVLLQVFV